MTLHDGDAGRILLISYHFGDNGPTGGFRWGAMAAGLSASGWEVDVITASATARPGPGVRIHRVPPPTWPSQWSGGLMGLARKLLLRGRKQAPSGPAGAAEMPSATSGTRPVVAPGPDTHTARIEALRQRADGLAIWQRGTPMRRGDALRRSFVAALTMAEDLHWARRAERVARTLLAAGGFRCIVVSSPPHNTQAAGARLARSTGIPYIADYRDPWVAGTAELQGYMSPFTRAVGGRLERSTQSAARLVIHNTPRMLERARGLSSLPTVRRVCVQNGYDGSVVAGPPDPDRFRVLFCGWLHPYMDVRVLFRAARRFADRTGIETDRFRLEFMGSPSHVDALSMEELAAAYGMEAHTDLLPRASRERALEVQERAAVLVAFDCPHPLAVAMKFYDYQLMRGHLLMIAEPGSALDQASRRIGSRAVSPSDEDGVLAVLEEGYERWRRGDYPGPNDPNGIFHRSRRTAEIRDLLASLSPTPLASIS